MSWRKLLGVEDSTDNPYTHNTHNAGKSSVQDNSAYIADSAYIVEIEKCRDNLIANHKVTNDSVQSELIKRAGPVVELSPDEENRIRAWLTYIDETDPAIIDEILKMCRVELKHREYFLKRSEEVSGS